MRGPESHSSGPLTTPSPQEPASRQAVVQTSYASVSGGAFAAPSSHSSAPDITPSPQRAVLGSVKQISEQPSPGTTLLSSHVSGPIVFPSPQIGTQGRPPCGQYQPIATVL